MSTVRTAAQALLDALERIGDTAVYADQVSALRAALAADTVEVPRVPTEAMLHQGAIQRMAADIYRRMIKAAQEAKG